MKKVLIVEDSAGWQEIWKRELSDLPDTYLLSALSIEEAERLFRANGPFDVIVMDACVPGDEPTTPPLVWMMRETYNGPIIACSSFSPYRDQLMQVGCNFSAMKEDVGGIVRRLLTSAGA